MDSNIKPSKGAKWAAEFYDCSTYRVYQMCREGLIPHFRLGRRVLFDPDKTQQFRDNGGKSLGQHHDDEEATDAD